MRSARPILVELSAKLRETVHIAALRGFEVIHLDSEVPEQLILTSSRVGLRLPANCTAVGKVLLAGLTPEVREKLVQELFAQSGFESRTPNTIVDPDKFSEHLSSVAIQGYGVDLEEHEIGLCCVAAPVMDESGQTVAAISVSGPSFRLSQDHLLGTVAPAAIAAAAKLSRNLGR